jgi:hypothetical protein
MRHQPIADQVRRWLDQQTRPVDPANQCGRRPRGRPPAVLTVAVDERDHPLHHHLSEPAIILARSPQLLAGPNNAIPAPTMDR